MESQQFPQRFQFALNELQDISRIFIKQKTSIGLFGQVHIGLIYGTKYMLKQIQKNKLTLKQQQCSFYKQIQLMGTPSTANIIKLYKTINNEEFIYLFFEHCEVGNLFKYQAKKDRMVFPLKQALQVIDGIMKGLFIIHKAGLLHRNLNITTILVKEQNKQMTYKLTDFGFSKTTDQILQLSKSQVNTKYYMSPQMYSINQHYGYEVDLWAVGVLLIYMLNGRYPFFIDESLSLQAKQDALKISAAGFSYKKFIDKNKNKNKNKNKIGIQQNRNQQIQDFFLRAFHPEPRDRMTFSQMSKHPLLQASKSYTVKQLSQIQKFYSKPYKKIEEVAFQNDLFISSNITLQTLGNTVNINPNSNLSIHSSVMLSRGNFLQFPAQSKIIVGEKERIDFLRHIAQIFWETEQCIEVDQVARKAMVYNLYKYYLILLRGFNQSFKTLDQYKVRHSQLDWDGYRKTLDYRQTQKVHEQNYEQMLVKYEWLYQLCCKDQQKITQGNEYFRPVFRREIIEKSFTDLHQGCQAFKLAYRVSVRNCYNFYRDKISENVDRRIKSNNANYFYATVLQICNIFNNIFLYPEKDTIIFKTYLQENTQDHSSTQNKTKMIRQIDLYHLTKWLQIQNSTELYNIIQSIREHYFIQNK